MSERATYSCFIHCQPFEALNPNDIRNSFERIELRQVGDLTRGSNLSPCGINTGTRMHLPDPVLLQTVLLEFGMHPRQR